MRDQRARRYRRRMELNKLYQSRRHRGLKYTAMGVFGVVVILFLTMIIVMDRLSVRMLLLLRGCAGALTIIGVALYAVYVYRINRDYQNGERGD